MKENIKLLYVDLFSGAGGTSTGVETSGVAKVIACVNHDKNAIASHAANHPEALHFVEDANSKREQLLRNRTMPPYLVQAESGEVQMVIFETDSKQMIKIKEFMCMYGIVDIKMRMLKIPELKMIMGFPKNYKLIGTQAEQKKYIGNAVEVTMARVLCKATVGGLINKKKMAI